MFNVGIPEKIIAETSGHRSTKALRFYERTNAEQEEAVTAIINSAVGKEVEKEVSDDKEKEVEKKVSDDKENVSQPLAPRPVVPQGFSAQIVQSTFH